MPGLLGQGWDDPQTSANMALAAGLLQGNLGAGFAGASQAYSGAQDSALKRQLVRSQMENFASEIEARKLKTIQDQRQQSMIEGMFPGLLGGPSSGAPTGSPPMAGAPQMPLPAAPGAAPGAMPGAPTQTMGAQPNDNDILALSQRLGIPPAAIKTDMVFNAGKGIAEMLYKRGTPDMQVTNGYAYDKNRTGPGYLPQLNVSQDGKTSMVQIDGQGMPVVSAPQGAYSTFGNYQRIQEGAKAALDPVTITPAGSSNPVMRSRLSVMQQADVPPQPGMSGAFTGDPAKAAAQIAAITDPQERANAQAAFDAQMKQGGGKLPPAGGGVALADPTMEAARKEQMVSSAKDVADQRKSIMNAGFVAPSNIAKYQQIGKLLADVDGGKFTPAGTEFASALNSFGVKIDKNLPNKQAAMSLANEAALQLRSPAGGAGMPGAMSDQDRTFLASMTPNIAQSAEGRKMVIDAYVAVQERNQEVAQFARKYEKKYGKLDNDFFDQLSAWANSNPLFKGK